MRTNTLLAVALLGLAAYLVLSSRSRSSNPIAGLVNKPVGTFTDTDWRAVFDRLPRELKWTEKRDIEAARLTAAQGITQGAIIGTSIFPGYGTAFGAAGGFIASELI